MDLAHFDPAVHRERRHRLADKLGSVPALIPAGIAQPRNYPANMFPFRASSHFLYLVGMPLPGAMALIEDDDCQVFVPQPAADDALWHGPRPGPTELEQMLGCRVRRLETLGDALGGRAAATLPAPDLETRQRQAALLGRELAATALEARDAELADAMVSLRLVHDAAAQNGLRRAAEATAAAHRAGMAATRPGIRESAVRAAMEAELITRGMTTAYGPIVTVHGEVLHNESHHHLLGGGDLLLADVGAETPDGWAGDVTRTWPVAGRFSTTQKELYEVVRNAQRMALGAVKPGVRYRDVHLTAGRGIAQGLVDLGILRGDPDELVADGVHALFFPHGVGHLLGLDVHDMEDLGDRAGYGKGRSRSEQFGLAALRLDRDLVPGMAVTVEPGFYQVPAILEDPSRTAKAGDRLDRSTLERFRDVRGIRIEDDVLVTDLGHEVLTASIPKEPAEVEAAVGATA